MYMKNLELGDEPVCHIALLCQIHLQSINSNFTLSGKKI